ncbi:MAG: ABC transporter ATP-binding protein, partial [Chitinophagaceae bacterium]|nr:ABC transporter ATP-binding protein [Anaerolineae bacterium]
AAKFDEIVDFAEVEQFIDTPVKRYSSGMYLRLAFAVAAHLEPEILLVDEVLAVGDAAFQKKCLGKMGDVARAGRTVLFVSHDMGAIQSLTHNCIYLKRGQIALHRPTQEVISQYLQESLQVARDKNASIDISFYRRSTVTKPVVLFTNVGVGGHFNEMAHIGMGESFTISVELEVFQKISGANLALILKNAQGQRISVFFSWDEEFYIDLAPGVYKISLQVENPPLAPGEYFVDIGINQSTNSTAYDVVLDVPLVSVVNTGQIVQWLERPWGNIHWKQVKWSYND